MSDQWEERAEMGAANFLRLVPPRTVYYAAVTQRVITDRFDRTPRRLELAAQLWPMPQTQLVCVYRYANHANVEAMLEGFDVQVALWALDRVHPALAPRTIGTGRAGRFSLLNRLVAEMPNDGSHLLVTDDDVTFAPGGLSTLVRTAARFCVDLAQPAHGPLSHCSWNFNRFQPGIAEESMMGWGQEVTWHLAAKNGLALGIIDGVRMRHRGQVAASYHRGEAEVANATALVEYGLTSNEEMQVTVANLTIH
jgi:hypothetical protein